MQSKGNKRAANLTVEVYDGNSLVKVRNAIVTITGHYVPPRHFKKPVSFSSSTGLLGFVRFTNIPVDMYTVEVTRKWYEPKVIAKVSTKIPGKDPVGHFAIPNNLAKIKYPKGTLYPMEQLSIVDFVGMSISVICPNNFHNPSDNHCAHFVSHVRGVTLGFRCRQMTGRGPEPGASIRVHEIFPECPQVGRWSDKPEGVTSCFAFVTSARNVNLENRTMTNVPAKHVGVFSNEKVYHYSNTNNHVVSQTVAEYRHHYRGTDIEVFYGTFPE